MFFYIMCNTILGVEKRRILPGACASLQKKVFFFVSLADKKRFGWAQKSQDAFYDLAASTICDVDKVIAVYRREQS